MSCLVCTEGKFSFPKISISIPPFKVLLLEDNPEDAFLLTRTLNQIGKVFWEQKLGNGIELAQQNEFDIALIDLNLVDNFSLEAFEVFHENCPDLPAIIIGNSEVLLLADTAIQAGALAVLNKARLQEGEYLIKMVTRYLLKVKFVKKAEKLFSKKKNKSQIHLV